MNQILHSTLILSLFGDTNRLCYQQTKDKWMFGKSHTWDSDSFSIRMKLWGWCFLFHDLYYKCFLASPSIGFQGESYIGWLWLTTRFNLSTREIPFLSFKREGVFGVEILFFWNESSAQKKQTNKQNPPEAITYTFLVVSTDIYFYIPIQ